jgi:RecA/RadA recombinase
VARVVRGKQPGKSAAKIAALDSIVRKSSSFRPARQVLKRVRAVPTIFPHLDYALKVGGWPIERLALIHGPSHEGKTLLAHGLGLSFLRRGHYYAYVDLERTTPITWLEKLFGPYADDEKFLAARPEGNEYEQVVDDVRDLITNVAERRDKGKLPKDTTVFVVIDSLRKLNPKKFIENLTKKGASAQGMDGMRGMGAAMKAARNAQWTDDLIPMLDDYMASLAFIGREYANQEAAGNPFVSEDYVVGGGKAVYFEASLSCRVQHQWIKGNAPEGVAPPIFGEKHKCRFKKSKVAGKEAKYIDSFFHSSNGAIVPSGFDLARDLVVLGREMDVIKEADKGWLSWQRMRWHGEHAAVKALTANPAKLEELNLCLRARYEVEGGTPHDSDGRVLT